MWVLEARKAKLGAGMGERPESAGLEKGEHPFGGQGLSVEIGLDLQLSLSVVVGVGLKLLVSAADFGMDFGMKNRTVSLHGKPRLRTLQLMPSCTICSWT